VLVGVEYALPFAVWVTRDPANSDPANPPPQGAAVPSVDGHRMSGMPDDYSELARYGLSVKGKIVIARYGNGARGLKPELAYEHGAVGCLIYSDPRDDGYFNGDPYPKGPWRPAQGVQRGSIMDEQYPGDPTTPGYGSFPGAKHLAIKDAKTILRIPVLLMSYADAAPMLKALGGPVAPESWRGACRSRITLAAGRPRCI
jgi:N-acetylated-alpha-linked acidic dipeptidase